eukprot:04745_6
MMMKYFGAELQAFDGSRRVSTRSLFCKSKASLDGTASTFTIITLTKARGTAGGLQSRRHLRQADLPFIAFPSAWFPTGAGHRLHSAATVPRGKSLRMIRKGQLAFIAKLTPARNRPQIPDEYFLTIKIDLRRESTTTIHHGCLSALS